MKKELESIQTRSFPSTGSFPSNHPSWKLPSWQLLILCLAAIPSPVFAQTLLIDRQINGIDHRFTPPDPVAGTPGVVQDVMDIDSAALTNVDLSQYQTFKLRLFAPAGQKLVANHGDAYRSGVNLVFVSGKDTVSHSETAVLGFENFVGAMPTRASSNFYIGDLGNGIMFQAAELYPGGGTGFTALSYSFTPDYNPANSPQNYTQDAAIIGCPMCFSYETTATTDPGPFVSLVENILPPAIPQLINYQGRVATGTPAVNFEGIGQFKFAMVNTDGTETFWSNDGTSTGGSEPATAVSLQVTKGLYSVLLGDISLLHMTAIPVTVFTHGDVRLRVWFDDGTHGSQLLSPDQRIAAVGYAMIAGNVPDGTITGAKIAAGTVDAANIAAGAVGSTQLAAGAVEGGKIAAGAVGSAQIADQAVGSSHLASEAVQASNIAAGAVGTAQMADFAITGDKLRLGIETGTDAEGEISLGSGAFSFTRTFDYPFTSPPTVSLLSPGWTLGPVSATGFSASFAFTPLVPDSEGDVGQYTSQVLVDGKPAISYQDAANGFLKYVRATDAAGTTWGPPVTVDMNGTFTSLAVVDGKPAISYFEAATGDLKYVRATDTGGTVWDAPVILDALATTQFTALAVVDGKPAVIYTASNSLKFLRATDASGTAWGAPVSIGSLSGPGQYASLAVVDGKPAISYVSNLPHFLKYVRAIDAEGAAWGTPLIINPGGPAGHYCSLKVINGNPAISCYEAINGDLRFLRATDAEGTTWGTAVVIDSTDDVGQFMSLAVIDGRPAISYHDATHSDLKYVQATDADGTAWGTPVTLDSVGNVGQHTSLALVDGAPAISYYDATNGDLKFIAISEPQLRWQASDGSVAPLTAATVTAGAIGSDQLAAGAVGTTQLAAGAVQTANIASGVIGSEQLATNAVQSGNIASGAVGSEQLAANAVQSSNISAGAVGTSQLADLAITDDKLRLGTEIGTIDDGALTAATGMFNFNATFDYPFTSPPTVNLLTPGWTLGPVTATGFSASRASVPPVPLTLDSMGSVGAVGQATSLAVVDGYPAVSYYDATNGDLKYLRATDASGSSWGVPVTVDTGGPGTVDVGVYTSLTVVDGCPAISYFDSTNDDLKYVRALDPAGNTWAAPLTLDSGGDVGSYTSLVVVDGFPAVCYYDNTNGDLKYLRATDAAGATWGTPVAFPDGGNFVGRCCSMTIVNGFPAISYQDSSVQQLKYVRASDATGTTWGTPTTISSTGTVSSFTSLAVVNGFPAISYRQGTSVSMLRFVRATDATGTAWGTPLALDNSNGKETCLKVIASIPTIIYQYGNPGGLKYVCATNASGTTWNTPFMLSGSASGSRHPSLAEVSGKAAISYHDSTSGDLKFVLLTADLRWQASDGSIAPLTAAGVAAGAIGSEQLATGAVQSANIAAGAIGSDQLAANAVQSGNIASGAIGSTQLAANAVLGSNIADGAVSSEQLAANAVQSANIAAGAVGTDQMADFAITSSKLRPGYVSGTLADGMTDVAPGVLAFSASFACPFDVAPAVNLLTPGWALGPISSSGFSATLTYQPQVIQQFFASLPPSPGRYTSLAVLTVGIPAVSYFDVSRTLKYVHAFNPRGTEWLPTAAITIDGTSNAGQYSSLAVVGGNPAIAYYAATTGDLKFVRSIDPMGTMSTMWDPPVTLDSADNVGQYVSLAEVDGNPAISYYDATNTSLKYIRAADSMGMSWETPLTLDSPDSSDSAGAHSSLAVINGNPAISYHDATNGDLKYIRATDATGSNWGPPLTVDTGDTANVGTFTSLIVVDGNPAISYYDGTNGDLKFVRATDANGTAWGTPVTPDSTGSVGTYCSLQVVYGRPAISYYDATISALKYVQASDASGTAWGAPLILDNTGMTGFHTSLAVVDGVPAVSYYEQYPAPAKYKFAVVPYDSAPELAWQASDGSVAPIIAATVASGAIGSTQLAANAVQTGNIASGAVGSAQLAPNLTISGTLSATAITGDGSGLTNIPASAVVTAPPGMVLIPAGAFTMGNTVAADTDITDASPVTVTLSAFYMAIHEVTLSQWQAVYLWATSNGYSFTNAGAGKSVNHPVHTVNWHDVVKWCNARSEMEGLTPCYTLSGATYKTGEDSVVVCNWSANGYRLPTEAEWEKAARGGLAGQRFPWGDTITQNLANYRGNTLISYDLGPDGYHPLGNDGTMPYTTPVGTFAANGYGLHDITGNIWEWCWDWYGTPYAGGGEPHGPTSGTDRVHRGGSWFSNTRCRTAYRDYSIPGNSYHHVGFRVTRKAVP